MIRKTVMATGLALTVALTIMLGCTGQAQAKPKDCGPELNQQYTAFLKDLRAQNFKSGAASGSGAAAKRLTAWLKKRHAEVVAHEKAHKAAAGKWGGQIEYLYYEWWNIPYAVAGCHILKKGVPLKIALKSALAPKQPSSWDLKLAKKLKELIAQGYKR